MDWLDRPIRAGDRFLPLTPCRVSSWGNTWFLEPNEGEGGRWARVSRSYAQEEPIEVAEPGWQPYEWIVWGTDSSDYRLRIGVGRQGQLTGIIEDVQGEWSTKRSPE